MKVAVVGATGLVGSKMLEILSERRFPVSELIPVASEQSAGRVIEWEGKAWRVVTCSDAVAMRPDLALFSAGGATSLDWAPKFAEVGCIVVDNSSAWRMDPDKKLVVPEVNGHVLGERDRIIANPNCSTIQMVMVLKPLHDKYRIKRVVVSTYQSVTGTGKAAVDQLMNEREGKEGPMAYRYPIDLNLIPQIDVFMANGYTKEEMKMILETNKIMGDDSIAVTATAVRVPVMGGHSESLNIEFGQTPDLNEARALLNAMRGVVVVDNPAAFEYPMPLIHAANKDDVFVGRIRLDESRANTINCWVVSDNLRKGAATNAVQIAEQLILSGFLSA
ncbi:MAG: aspartate-semialdehyde dehydrogenase [Flavobacteriales bacterium]|jgi:aspartate-semialdehyde dehydrogenase